MDKRPVVVGAGQAGLAVSYELSKRGIEHVVLERGRIGQTWRGRWNSFCLVTPNWSVQLPGHPYDGDDPDGYMPRDEIVAYLERYAARTDAPVQEGIEVRSLGPGPEKTLVLETNRGTMQAETVVVCTGAYQRPYRPPGGSTFPAGTFVIDADEYRNPTDLPAGAVLVIGSGQTGCQIAEELVESGREVTLACGRAPWLPRRIGGRDVIWWVVETGFWDAPLSSLPSPAARLFANVLNSGHGGGRDLHLRTLQAQGVTLAGHFSGVVDGRVCFAGDLSDIVAWGDNKYAEFMNLVRKTATEKGIATPEIATPEPFAGAGPESVDLRRIGAVLFTGGFRPDYGSWVRFPEVFDDQGFPIHANGASVAVPGLYFAGVHFLRKRKSSLFYGVGEDAALVAQSIAERFAPSSRQRA